jgi:membrane protein DedA with SNARE-associated domain
MFDWMVSVVQTSGYIGIALLLFAENLFPPIPSDVILPMAGFLAARGELNVVGVVIAGASGSVAGAYFWYFLAKQIKTARLKKLAAKYGRWLTVHPRDIDRAHTWFEKHGNGTVFFCRWIPGIHSLISLPAGVAKMNHVSFLVYTIGGTLSWVTPYVVSGYLLKGSFEKVSEWLNPVTNVILVSFFGIYLWRVIRFNK